MSDARDVREVAEVSWRRAGPNAYVVELKLADLPILHRYFASENGARACAEAWMRALLATKEPTHE